MLMLLLFFSGVVWVWQLVELVIWEGCSQFWCLDLGMRGSPNFDLLRTIQTTRRINYQLPFKMQHRIQVRATR